VLAETAETVGTRVIIESAGKAYISIYTRNRHITGWDVPVFAAVRAGIVANDTWETCKIVRIYMYVR
jgi:hypothetical protein